MKKWVKDVVNNDRRRFLKVLAAGGGLLAMGKLFQIFTENRVVSQTDFKNFKLIETGKQIKVAERSGREILVIDKEGF